VKRRNRKKQNSSGNCLCEICKSKFVLEEHHLRGRKVENCHKDSNIANICPNCHTLVHRGELIIEGRFLTTNGYELIWRKRDEKTITGQETTPHIIKN
jgi:hypothetical protein